MSLKIVISYFIKIYYRPPPFILTFSGHAPIYILSHCVITSHLLISIDACCSFNFYCRFLIHIPFCSVSNVVDFVVYFPCTCFLYCILRLSTCILIKVICIIIRWIRSDSCHLSCQTIRNPCVVLINCVCVQIHWWSRLRIVKWLRDHLSSEESLWRKSLLKKVRQWWQSYYL